MITAIKYFDCFAGIGGFRSGLELAGGFECIAYCEIDKNAAKVYKCLYDTQKERYFEDITRIRPNDFADGFDLFVGGFPCQPFSVAGRRLGFEDTRGTMFYHIARLLHDLHPPAVLLENVPGILSHNEGSTFGTILGLLSDLGYCVEWRVFNSACFGVPQHRQRVYIVGYTRKECAGKVLSFKTFAGKSPYQLIGGSQGARVYSANGTAITQTAGGGGGGSKTGLYFIDLSCDARVTELARCITARYDSGISKHKGEKSGVFVEIKDENTEGCVTFKDKDGIIHVGRIRKLMPLECWRLQGFTDEQFYKAKGLGMSDTLLWKMAGNAVSVSVVKAVGERIRKVIFEGGEENVGF